MPAKTTNSGIAAIFVCVNAQISNLELAKNGARQKNIMAHYMDNDMNPILLNFRKSIKDYNYNKLSVDDWVNIISDEMSLNYITTPYKLDPKVLFRARVNADGDGNKIDFFTNISDLWAPADKDVKKQGRCNTKGQSLLYCSSSLLTTLYEVRPQPNHDITIIEYESLGEIGLLGVLGVTSLIPVSADYKKIFKKHHKHMTKKALLLDNHFAEIFKSKDENSEEFPIYNLTNALSQIFLTNTKSNLFPPHVISPSFKGLVYPSVSTRKALGMNMAFYPNDVKDALKPFRAYKYKILEKYSEHKYAVVMTHFTKDISDIGSFSWVENVKCRVEITNDIEE